jgi:hypothetical protein
LKRIGVHVYDTEEAAEATSEEEYDLNSGAAKANVIQKRKNYRQIKTLLRCVTMSLSLRKYLPPPELVCNRDTTNFSPGYNGAQKLLYINCVLHKRS